MQLRRRESEGQLMPVGCPSGGGNDKKESGHITCGCKHIRAGERPELTNRGVISQR